MMDFEKEFERQLRRRTGGGSTSATRAANKKAVAGAAARGQLQRERGSVVWGAIRADSKARQGRGAEAMAQETVCEFLGQDSIGFEGRCAPVLLKRRGRDEAPPKGWTEDQVELQEMRDMVVQSRARGTWDAYARWWQTFSSYASSKGEQTHQWRRDSERDRQAMSHLLRRLVNKMRKLYAYGTVNMMVTAVARAAKDFGWPNPRDDDVLAAMLKGLAHLKGLNKKKQQAMLGEHVKAIMALRKRGGVTLVQWALLKAIVIVGWMAFLRVSEMLGGGKLKSGELKDGPSGLDVCDVTFVTDQGANNRLEVVVRSAKNDQAMEGHTTSVYADELEGEACAVQRLRDWMSLAQLKRSKGCTKGRLGCEDCGRKKCICDCTACGKMFRSVTHGKVQPHPMARSGLTRHLRALYARLEEDGVVPEGMAETVSGISLRAGGVTEAAAMGIERELLAGHGRWKSNSGPEQYDRQDKRKFKGVTAALQRSLRDHSEGKKRKR